MRIAISGAHRTGKSTLVAALASALPSLAVVEEPYHQLVDEGVPFEETPGLDGFVLQLERSLEDLEGGPADALFDRCPLDFLAYLACDPDPEAFDLARWLPRIVPAMERLDLVVFVPVEEPDRVEVPADEAGLRARVHDELAEIVLADRWSFGVEALEVRGTPRERADQVLAWAR